MIKRILLILLALAAPVAALGQVSLSQTDFDGKQWYVADLPGVTYQLSEDITVPRNGVLFAHTADGSTLDLNGYTLTFDSSVADSSSGVYLAPSYFSATQDPMVNEEYCGGNGAQNITITGGAITQGAGAGTHSECVGGGASTSVIVSDVTMTVSGVDSEGVDMRWCHGVVVSDCTIYNNSPTVSNRHSGKASIDVSDITQPYYRIQIERCNIIGGPQWGVRVERRTHTYAPTDSVIVRGCDISMDTDVTNGYGIGMHSGWYDASWNYIHPVNGRGIHMETTDHEIYSQIKDGFIVHDNTIVVREGPNSEYTNLFSHGIKLEYVKNAEIWNNNVTAYAASDTVVYSAHALDIALTLVPEVCSGNYIHDNVFAAYEEGGSTPSLLPLFSYAAAIMITALPEGTGLRIEDNTFITNSVWLYYAYDTGVYGAGVGQDYLNCTWETTAPASGHVFRPMVLRHADDFTGSRIVNPTYTGSDEFTPSGYAQFASIGEFDHGQYWTLTATVTDAGSPVQGATVTATDSQDTTWDSGITNASGQVELVVPEWIIDSSTGEYTAGIYTVGAAYNGDSDSNTYNGTAPGSVSLVLTEGGAEEPGFSIGTAEVTGGNISLEWNDDGSATFKVQVAIKGVRMYTAVTDTNIILFPVANDTVDIRVDSSNGSVARTNTN